MGPSLIIGGLAGTIKALKKSADWINAATLIHKKEKESVKEGGAGVRIMEIAYTNEELAKLPPELQLFILDAVDAAAAMREAEKVTGQGR